MEIICHRKVGDRMKQKTLVRMTTVLMVIAVVFSCILIVGSGGSSVRPIEKEYATTLFQKNKIMEVNIVIDEDDWQDMLDNARDETYIPCDVEVNGTTYKNVAIRPKGNTSLTQVTNDRYSFKIQFDEYQDGQTCDGLDQLILNNNFSDATYMKEYLAYDMFQYMGVVTPLYSYANVKVNGETYGLYLALEGVKESFAERNYGTSHGELYKPESTQAGGGDGKGNLDNSKFPNEKSDTTKMPSPPDKEGEFQENQKVPMQQGKQDGGMENSSGTDLVYTDDDIDSYSDVFDSAVFDVITEAQKRFISALKGIQTGENLSDYMDVEATLKYFAVNTFLVNYDSYTGNLKHNYYVYEKDGILTMLPWDLNLAFAGYQSNHATSAVNDPIDTPVSGTTLEERPMIGQLLNNETYMEQYHNYIDQLVTGYIESGRYEAVITQLKELISEYVKNDPTAFYTYDEYVEAVENLESFIELRGESVRGQLGGTIPSTDDEQKENPDSLIDASDISITAMGTMGAGSSHDKVTNSSNENVKEEKQTETGSENFQGEPPAGTGGENFQGEPPAGVGNENFQGELPAGVGSENSQGELSAGVGSENFQGELPTGIGDEQSQGESSNEAESEQILNRDMHEKRNIGSFQNVDHTKKVVVISFSSILGVVFVYFIIWKWPRRKYHT